MAGNTRRHDKTAKASRAEDLFQAIRTDGHKAIDRLIKDRAAEELFLDFKLSADMGAGNTLNEKDRSNLAKAVCGFGNAEGGIIVWGVECSDDGRTGDLPSRKIGIADPARFRANVESAISGCTIPPHSKVENLVIAPTDESPGIVVTMVPKAHQAPLQTVKDLRFLVRAGSSFVPMPHGMVASLFGRPPAPHCFPNYILAVPTITDDEAIHVGFGIAIVNDGPGVAENLYVTTTISSLPGEQTEASFDPPDTKNWSGGVAFGVRYSLTSNPGYRLGPEGMVQPMVIHIVFKPPFTDPLRMKILAGASGSIPYSEEIFVPTDKVRTTYENAIGAHRAGAEQDMHKVASQLLGNDDD